ncbi:MAG: cephalosporin hydroxylase family protein [Nitrosomonas sp.]|nr:cephalosporin hydroxylase family protein [Nitrosomonas sp.]MDP1949822.1 cephalosporin hydroxylase family protein [Nitrosomonas sp.]
MNEFVKQFEAEKIARIEALGKDTEFQHRSRDWLEESMRKSYVYNFSWMGRPIIQNPMDIMAMQEIIWEVKPDLIIETGIAHGGSLIFSASMLELVASCTGVEGEVIGIDIDIRPYNRKAIENHPMSKRITLFEGSSIAPEIIAQVKEMAKGRKRILVCMDSNHTHDHVLAELEAYASLTSVGSYCVVFDTFVEDVPADVFHNRPWHPGNSPKTAVWEYLKSHPEFEIDKTIQNKLLITVSPDGYLKRVF